MMLNGSRGRGLSAPARGGVGDARRKGRNITVIRRPATMPREAEIRNDHPGLVGGLISLLMAASPVGSCQLCAGLR